MTLEPDPSVSPQTYEYFEQEATELLQMMEGELQNLRQDFNIQKVHNLMRAAHTLKGASASVGLETIKKTTHSLEDIFRALCHQDTVVSVEMERLIFQGFNCLQLLMSAQLDGAQVDGADILDRMAAVVSQLQAMLGDRFGQGGHLPTSSELGFDMTQSIFDMGVAQRIEGLSGALKNPDPEELLVLLRTQAEVFNGLGESLELPGFQKIAQTTLQAIQQQPEQILAIAPVALANFEAAHKAVLAGDRTQGGSPSAALKQFCKRKAPTAARPTAHINNPTHQKPSGNWLQRRWQKLTHSKETFSAPPSPPASPVSAPLSPSALSPSALSPSNSPVSSTERLTTSISTAADSSEFTVSELAELAPAELGALNIQPEGSAEPLPLLELVPPIDPEIDLEIAPEIAPEIEQLATPEPPVAPQSGPTIRISIEHLDQLSQSMGELLTQQNRQVLYNEQLSTLVKKLLGRISKQQQQLHQQQNQALTRKRFQTQPIAPTVTRSANLAAPNLAAPNLAAPNLAAPNLADANLVDTSLSDTNLIYGNFDALELDDYSDTQLVIQSCLEETVQQSESAEAIELFVRRSEEALEKQKRLLTQTRETLLEARMVPLQTIFERFPPAVERLQAQYRKEVAIATEGGDILVDKTIADKLYEPLLHLVRNAFDHGIESAEERLLQDKLVGGNITLQGAQRGRHLIIRVQDDGKGLDLDLIRRKALENQLITLAQADALTPAQTIDLLFEAGFSTLKGDNTLSGRGVGLDAVRARVRSLQGWVTVDHEPGNGSCFTLQIPASLTIAKLLLCKAQGRVYALIADAIEHILIPTAQQVREWDGGKMLTWQANEDEYLVPVNALNEVLHYASPMSEYRHTTPRQSQKEAASRPVILLHHQDTGPQNTGPQNTGPQNTLVGLEVDQLLGEQELVISPLGETVVPPPYLYGSSILPDGQLTLVLDGVMLAKIIVEQRKHNLETSAAKRPITPAKNKPIFVKKLILTIDDSITVRNSLSEALQKANYQVIQARDGAEALQQLERYPDVQAILCDIEMPGMNGFEFLKVRQRTPEIAAIPTVMLTSRMGTKHRLLTEELGATTYLTKPYLTPKLLQTLAEAIESQAGRPAESEPQLSTSQLSTSQLSTSQLSTSQLSISGEAHE